MNTITTFNTSMLGLVTGYNFFLELIRMCSYLLVGFLFTQPIAPSACQKAFVNYSCRGFWYVIRNFRLRSR